MFVPVYSVQLNFCGILLNIPRLHNNSGQCIITIYQYYKVKRLKDYIDERECSRQKAE